MVRSPGRRSNVALAIGRRRAAWLVTQPASPLATLLAWPSAVLRNDAVTSRIRALAWAAPTHVPYRSRPLHVPLSHLSPPPTPLTTLAAHRTCGWHAGLHGRRGLRRRLGHARVACPANVPAAALRASAAALIRPSGGERPRQLPDCAVDEGIAT